MITGALKVSDAIIIPVLLALLRLCSAVQRPAWALLGHLWLQSLLP